MDWVRPVASRQMRSRQKHAHGCSAPTGDSPGSVNKTTVEKGEDGESGREERKKNKDERQKEEGRETEGRKTDE